LGTAQAKEFYTRKRIRGRWVSGRFSKRYAAHRSGRRHETETEAPPQRLAALPPRPQVGRETWTEPRPEAKSAEAAAPQEDRLAKLQRALEARARTIATASAAEVTSSVRSFEVPGWTRPEPRSVSFDFESGLKTTTFAGGLVVRESFDVSTLKGLAASPPGNETLAAAKP
jgi:hypothetical protein